jgi:hypothetical protein
MTQEVLKKMYQLLLTEPHAPNVCAQLERIAREALADHAMQEVQRLGQDIEQEPVGVVHHKLTSTLGADYEQVAVFVRPLEPGTKLYTAVTTPPQPEQEPVAIKRMKEWIEYLKCKSDFGQHMKIPSEMSAGTCWELAIELEQFINTTPPQRTWVGLNDDEIDYLIHLAYTGDEEFVQTIEAKLKEKNT